MKIIKLAMISNDLIMNGISNVVMSYSKELVKTAFEVHIIAGTPVSTVHQREAGQYGIKIWELSPRKKRSIQYYKELFGILKREKFDIAHVHGNSATITVELLLAWLGGIHVRIAHSHNTTCTHMKIHNILYPLFSKLYTHGFACSMSAGEWLFHEKPFTVIQNGFNTDRFIFNEEDRAQIREQLHLKETDFVIGHIGRFNYQKNQEFLLQIFKKVAQTKPDAWLLLIGDGPDLDKINNIIKQHPYSERIIVYGETDETSKMYAAMDIFVFPSRHEGLGIVVLEAQINGLPCMVSDVVPKDILVGGDVQFLPLQAGARIWAEKICEAEIDIEKRKCFFKENSDNIAKYNIQKNAEQLGNIYRRIIKQKG